MIVVAQLTFGPLPSFDTFAKVYAALPDNFRPSALCAIRQHPAHQMSAVLSPTVWSSEHDVEQTRCVAPRVKHLVASPCGVPQGTGLTGVVACCGCVMPCDAVGGLRKWKSTEQGREVQALVPTCVPGW